MKVVITGATGFVGANLIRHFHSLGHEIIAMGRNEAPEKLRPFAEYIRLDLHGTANYKSIVADVCIHAAALTSTDANYTEMLSTNLHGTEKLLKTVKCRHFIYISSSSVYTPGITIPENRTDIRNTGLSAYGKSKLLAELLLIDAFNKKGSFENLTIFRPRAIYGKGDRLLLPKLLRLVKGNTLLWPGNKNAVSSMTHISNLCSACAFIIQTPYGDKEIYNICDNNTYNLYDTVKLLLEIIGNKRLKTTFLPARHLLPIIKLLYGNDNLYFELQQLNASMSLDTGRLRQQSGFTSEAIFSADEIGNWYNHSGIAGYPKYLWPWIE